MRHPPCRALLALPLLLAACAVPAPRGPIDVISTRGGGALHYVDLGDDLGIEPALVLVHGWAGDTTAWAPLLETPGPLGRVLAVDLPGHGRSSPPASWSMAAFADAVVAAMDHAGVARGVIVGHSNGVPVAYNVYARHPERVAALVALDGGLRPAFPAEAAEPMFAPFRGDDWRAAMRGMIEGMPAPGLGDEQRAAILAMALRQRHDAVIGGFEAAIAPDAYPDVPVDVPLLCLMTVSPFWNEDYVAFVEGLAPGHDYVRFEGAGHYLQLERPDEVEAALLAFLERRGLR